METFGQLTVLGRETGTIRELLSAAEAHEDCREGKEQADQDAPAPNEMYPVCVGRNETAPDLLPTIYFSRAHSDKTLDY